MKTVYKLAIAVFSLTLIISCGDDEFEKVSSEEVDINLGGEVAYACPNCLVVDENDPANFYSRIDSVSQYGFGTYYTLPDSLKDCALKLILTGKIRETESITGSIAVALHSKDSILFWSQIKVNQHLTEKNKWANFKDSIMIPKQSNTSLSNLLKVFQFKTIGSGFYDIDNLNVKIIPQ